ncbi:MAG: glutamine--tRNA ligase/YqeY domain fusion protein [Opitutales bacterium]|nr:glutamine--tRNA ligase/YqeY domain fusion protein [Opitutales bacterium]
MSEEEAINKHFIYEAIVGDLETGRFKEVITRFPPEPNGYLHIGHAKAFSIDFGMAQAFGGYCNLRMDDTNPEKEDTEYIEAIKKDIHWMGYDWKNFCYASDYFDTLYGYAIQLIEKGLAYVDDLKPEQMREFRGTLTNPGKESPNRNRSVEENLDLFHRMKAGEFEDGAYVLRAKIDMAHPNLNMRDPVMYRIKHMEHHRTGNAWCIYPSYDFTHGQSDSIEGITHSLCSLEFEDHRPLYNWFCEQLEIFHPRQIEFSRLNLTYTVMSKRKLRTLVEENYVAGWDDPRMPTLCGMRRRGYTPNAIKLFLDKVGVTKFNSTTDIALLEHCVRQDLEVTAYRRMVVLDPLKVVITNFPEETEFYEGENLPSSPEYGSRKVALTREIYVEREDFMEDAPKKFFRLSVGREVRLRYACYITVNEVIKDDLGNIVELRATFDPESRGASTPDGRKVKGTIHWVSASQNVPVEVRIYDRLFTVESPEAVEDGQDWLDSINPESIAQVSAFAEAAIADAEKGAIFQFERKGYYILDDSTEGQKMVFNRTVALKDGWSKKASQ